MIDIKNVTKNNKRHILNDVSISIQDGSFAALIGPARAGKTTLIKLLAGIYKPDGGSVLMDDAPIFENSQAKGKIAAIMSDLTYPGHVTLKKLSSQMKGYYDEFYETRYHDLVSRCHLDEKVKYKKVSDETRVLWQAVLALSIMPSVLLVDLNAADRDILQTSDLWPLIDEDVKNRQMSVLMTGRSIKEFTICDQVILIKKGKIVFSEDLRKHDDRVHKVKITYAKEQIRDYDGLRVLYEETNDDHDVIIVENTLSDIHERLTEGSALSCEYLPLTLEEFFLFELGGERDGFKDFIF